MQAKSLFHLFINILFIVMFYSSTSSFGYPSDQLSKTRTYFIIPGYIVAGPRRGGEITLARNQTSNSNNIDFEGAAIVLGGWRDPNQERSIELQVHGQGHVLFGLSAGMGAYRSKLAHGVQGTISLQYMTPFLIFAREQIQTSPVVVARKPQFGLMFKLPIPPPFGLKI